ncbi:methyltransferase domain-containing protein [Hahella sp. CCB-MM4]|uniref:methyltransferase domain-containing protein n=1 Tax=Hahella sp. (strain CCB-MM4) TaxID=1926491 RepID=UPI000B9B03C3|nr:methyltransferase domain-containing protein [Hahella sp. CCB-MM4]
MDTSSLSCRVCHSDALYVGATDFNKSGNDHFEHRRLFPVAEDQVAYYRCQHCKLMFTPYFDDWNDNDFRQRVYNHEYLLADPPFAGERPARLADYLAGLLGDEHKDLAMLDFGGGSGQLEDYLKALGIQNCTTYDPHHHENDTRPELEFDLVTAFEVVEHVSDQYDLFRDLCSLVANDGVLLISTLLQPDNIDTLGTDWWYVCPRNAHMTFHTRESLQWVLQEYGFTLHSLSEELHIAYRHPNRLSERFVSRAGIVQVNSQPSPEKQMA